MDSVKTPNPCRGATATEERKERSKPLKKQAIRNQEYYGVTQLHEKLYEESQNGKHFYELMELITSLENIRLAYRNLKSNSGSYTPGVDGKNIEDLMELEDSELVEIVRENLKEYRPLPVRRVEIPKPGSNKKRPLGIPSITDRLIQQCIKQILEPIVEAQFFPHSYGFRPDRGVSNAICRFQNLANLYKTHYVVDVDIKGFFDNVDHNKLRKQLWTLGIRDRKLLCIITAMLKANIVMPNGEVISPEKGTPQGGIISPLLANVVLNELDWWVAGQWELFPITYEMTGEEHEYSCNSTRFNKLRSTNLKEMYIVRYADDFKIFTRTRKQADRILKAVTLWLDERLHLQTSPEKTKITNLRKENSEFLGFRFKLRKKGDRLVLFSHMTNKARNKIKDNLNEQVGRIQRASCSKERHEAINRLNSMIMGYHEYYSLATNCSKDFNDINAGFRKRLYNRVLKTIKDPKKGELDKNSAVYEKYGKSKQLRFVGGQPIVPLSYCKHTNPMGIPSEFSRFKFKDRAKIHKSLGVNLKELHKLMRQPIIGKSIEYVDNRISKYCAQYGECYVTGINLGANDIHCHHITPIELGGQDDSYENIVIVHEFVHFLIHAKEVDTIIKYLPIIKDEKQLKRLNKLRRLAGRRPIPNLNPYGVQLSFFGF